MMDLERRAINIKAFFDIFNEYETKDEILSKKSKQKFLLRCMETRKTARMSDS